MAHLITLKNSFHRTSTRVRVPAEIETEDEAWYWLQASMFDGQPTSADRARYNRIRRTLCGHQDCTCGIVRS